MFENILEDNLNIYAVTSTSPKNGSYSWYCDEEAVVNGTLLGTCLSDQFTAAWMVDADHFDICDETLEEQFCAVKEAVFLDPVSKFGDLSFQSDFAGDFIGSCKDAPTYSYKMVTKNDIYCHFYISDLQACTHHFSSSEASESLDISTDI